MKPATDYRDKYAYVLFNEAVNISDYAALKWPARLCRSPDVLSSNLGGSETGHP
jgi:hypothetical protein